MKNLKKENCFGKSFVALLYVFSLLIFGLSRLCYSVVLSCVMLWDLVIERIKGDRTSAAIIRTVFPYT